MSIGFIRQASMAENPMLAAVFCPNEAFDYT